MLTNVTYTGRSEVRMEYIKAGDGHRVDIEVTLTPEEVFELMYDIIADADLGNPTLRDALLDIADSIHGAITCANEAYED